MYIVYMYVCVIILSTVIREDFLTNFKELRGSSKTFEESLVHSFFYFCFIFKAFYTIWPYFKIMCTYKSKLSNQNYKQQIFPNWEGTL